MSSQCDQIPIPELYRQTNHVTDHGIAGYHVVKKYEDPLQIMKSRELSSGVNQIKKHETKRGNFLDDQTNAHKFVPGPGKYKFADEWPEKSKSLQPVVYKKTYIAELMEKQKKEKKPAPGHYKTFKSQKQIQADKKVLASRKIKVNDRTTYLDHIEYEALLTPGVGAYNPRKRVQTEVGRVKTNPEEWRKKHDLQGKKKKPGKLPDMRTYNPLPSAYLLFENNNKLKANKNFLGRLERFKTQKSGSGIGPGKYMCIQEWRGKDVKKQRHGLQSLTKGVSKSVYYH